jgi:hypothetical protein
MFYPKIRAVTPLDNSRLHVAFDNGICKIYDCKPLLRMPVFAPLANGWLFRAVQADPGGYGVSWNEDIDLAEAELWEHGIALDMGQAAMAPA